MSVPLIHPVYAASPGVQDSCPDYMLKAEACLAAEEERVDVYLHASTKSKLLKEVETELLANYEQRLLTKEHSGCAALLRDDKVCCRRHGAHEGDADIALYCCSQSQTCQALQASAMHAMDDTCCSLAHLSKALSAKHFNITGFKMPVLVQA